MHIWYVYLSLHLDTNMHVKWYLTVFACANRLNGPPSRAHLGSHVPAQVRLSLLSAMHACVRMLLTPAALLVRAACLHVSVPLSLPSVWKMWTHVRIFCVCVCACFLSYLRMEIRCAASVGNTDALCLHLLLRRCFTGTGHGRSECAHLYSLFVMQICMAW